MRGDKKPLYRKVNTTAHGVHHRGGVGGATKARDLRGKKRNAPNTDGFRKMRKGALHGLDYTPLYRFLLSKVGEPWADVHQEAVARLDQEAPLYQLVAVNEADRRDVVRTGESSYFSGLFVSDAGLLEIVAPALGPEQLFPWCHCCTHTFNGQPFGNAFDPEKPGQGLS